MENQPVEIDIDAVARLARLELSDAERELLGGQLESILAYVDQLETLDTEGVPATHHPVALDTPYRDDEVGGHLPRAAALSNAPETDGASFVVPRVV